MPWAIKKRDNQYCVYRQGSGGNPQGSPRGCHSSRAKARAQMRALYALAAGVGPLVDPEALVADGSPGLIPWASMVVPIGQASSGDRRIVDAGVSFRPMPIPLWAELFHSGHNNAPLVGRVDRMWVEGDHVMASGVVDPALDYADQALVAIRSGALKSVSFDPAGGNAETEILKTDPATEEVLDWLTHYEDLVIGGLTLVGIPAWEGTWLRLDEPVQAQPLRPMLVASADLPDSERPPIDYFTDPQLKGRTRVTIDPADDNGHRRIYGHLAPWGECHIGIQDRCQMAPHSATNYGWFTLGTMTCAEGCRIPIGTIVMDSGHAPRTAGADRARSYYDQTGWAAADVAVGEDQHGIWFSGALRRGLSTDQAIALEAARLSGDWRPMGGNLELIAVAAVNTGGFPVYEEAVAADGSVQSLVWAPEFDPETRNRPGVKGAALLMDMLAARVHPADFDEDAHPRGPDGKFGQGEGTKGETEEKADTGGGRGDLVAPEAAAIASFVKEGDQLAKSIPTPVRQDARKYTSTDAVFRMNSDLRQNGKVFEKERPVDEALQKVIEAGKGQAPPDLVWRGAEVHDPSKFEVGAVIHDPAYTSTSIDPRVASSFSKPLPTEGPPKVDPKTGIPERTFAIFEIKPKAGGGANISGKGIRKAPVEAEYLINRGSSFRVTGVRQAKLDHTKDDLYRQFGVKQMHIIEMEQL